MNPPIRIALVLALLAPLAGCGAKGPLFMPPPAPPVEVPPEAPAADPHDDEGAPVPAEPAPQAAPATEDGNE